MFSLIIILTEFGDYIGEHPKNYSCPDYCQAEHEHINLVIEEVQQIDSTMFIEPLEQEIASQIIEIKEKDK